jgi:hypothetical protein
MRDRSWRAAVEGALARLRDGYGAGQISTATLEVRAAAVLVARAEADLDDAVWDLPSRRRRGRPPSALVFEPPAGPAAEWPLAPGSCVLGRSSGCDLVLDDGAVSRRHAELALRGGACMIRDLGSCNGTLVNGRRVRRAELRAGDILCLGETVVRVR